MERDRIPEIVRGLLTGMNAAGRGGEFEGFVREFDLRGWGDLERADLDRVLEAVAGASDRSPAPGKTPTEHPPRVDPAIQRPGDAFGSFLDAIPDGRRLLALIDAVARAEKPAEATRALKNIFVDHLAYEDHGLDETGRLGSQQTIRSLRTIARHGLFTISVVELEFPLKHPSVVTSVFQLHPYGLVICIARGWNSVRFVFRRTRDSTDAPLRFRTLVGDRLGNDVHDNLVTWVRRLDLLRPRQDDTEASMQERAQAVMTASAADVASRMCSVALDPSEPVPGRSWSTLFRHEAAAFLQTDVPGNERSFWGLERVLRTRFPLVIAQRAARLRYLGYHIPPLVSDVPPTPGTPGSWLRPLVIELELIVKGAATQRFSVPAAVPMVSAEGRLLLDGTWHRFVPRVRDDGSMRSPIPGRATEDSPEDLFALLADPSDGANDGEDLGRDAPVGDAVPPELQLDVEPELEDLPEFSGASFCSLFELASLRMFGALARYLWLIDPAEPDLGARVRDNLAALSGSEGLFVVVSRSYLRQVLEAAPEGRSPERRLSVLRTVRGGRADAPPPWACPDVSATLGVGNWFPVAAARLNPGGELVVPLLDAEGRLRLAATKEPAHRVNARCTGAPVGQPSWWIAEGLDGYAHLPPGGLSGAAHVLARSLRVPPVLAVGVPGTRLQARVSATALARRPVQSEHLVVRIPNPSWLLVDHPPRLLVRTGQNVSSGDRWLSAAGLLWSQADKLPASSTWSFLREVLEGKKGAKEPTRPKTALLIGAAPAEGTDRHTPAGVDEADAIEEVAAEHLDETEEAEEAEETELIRAAESGELAEWETRRFEGAECWRIPPGIAGTVTACSVSEIRGRRGASLGWIASVTVSWRLGLAGHLVLPDGRAAPIVGVLRTEDAPYRDAITTAGICVEDPYLSAGSLEPWIDAKSGETQAAKRYGGEFRLLPPESGTSLVGPDAWLRFRLRDADGIPAHPSAAGATASERHWWVVRAPEFAQAVRQSEQRYSGGLPPYWPTARALFLAATDTLPLGARAVHPSRLDLQVNRVRRRGFLNVPGFLPPRTWRCNCGNVRGVHRAFEHCGSCLSPVLCVARSDSRASLPFFLPTHVFHPWRLDACAALIGATSEEFLGLFAANGFAHVRGLLEAALREPDPCRSARARVDGTPDGPLRDRLGRALHDLQLELRRPPAEVLNRWVVRAIPWLAPWAHPTGAPSRSRGLVSSPITARLYRVRYASQRVVRVADCASYVLVEESRRSLQEAVCELYGPAGQGSHDREPSNIAELVTRMWPLTRAPRLRSSPPGLFLLAGELDPDGEPVGSVDEVTLSGSQNPSASAADDDGDEAAAVGTQRLPILARPGPAGEVRLGIADGGRLKLAPRLPSAVGLPTSADFWRQRAGMARMIGWGMPFIGAVIGPFSAGAFPADPAGSGPPSFDPPSEPDAWADLGPALPTGLELMRDLAVALCAADSRPADLVSLLAGKRPRYLPTELAAAEAVVLPSIEAAFPGAATPLVLGRRILARALAGWCQVAVSGVGPLGWCWRGFGQTQPTGCRRAVPPYDASAWRLWPEAEAALAPLRFFQRLPEPTAWSPLLREAAWFDGEFAAPPRPDPVPAVAEAPAVVPVFVPDTSPDTDFLPPSPVEAGSMTSRLDDAPTVCLLDTSILDWLGRTR